MKRKYLILTLFLAAALSLCFSQALADSGRIVTPGGKLNMRVSPKKNAKLAGYVPNHELVEVEEVGESWTQIVYKGKTGYVMNEYIRVSSQLPGLTVYPDEGIALLREDAGSDSPVIRPIGGCEAVEVEALEGEYALVHAGEDTGYLPVSALSYQHTQPPEALSWISQGGMMAEAAPLYAQADEKSISIGHMPAGEIVSVSAVQKDFCLVTGPGGCGFAPVSSVSLIGPEDSEEETGSLTQGEALEKAEKTLSKKFKAFDEDPLYYQIAPLDEQDGLQGPLYLCGFFNDEDQYCYAALVHAESGEVVFTADYRAFALPSDNIHLLPHGEASLTLSADSLMAGEILDIEVIAWTTHECRYTLHREGKRLFSGEATDHFEASWLAQQEGEYTLTVEITDQEGYTQTLSEDFTVSGEADRGLKDIYSQKDGSWLDVAYRKSNMDKSGCAIFALSHALNRMGHTGDDILPQNLADTFSLCLTEDGTNNERLLRDASEIYGFKTARDLIESEKTIKKRLQEGCLFSFSV
ncbi:MAG: SH3 domain-containing protein, partial [Bacillota bacterium]|nr:SH3 domain-containing protein [Bacillota bacterium]